MTGNLLWWVIPGVLAGMPMPFVHLDRRMNFGVPLAAYDDDLPVLYAAGIRAVVSLLNIPSDAAVFETAGFAFLCLPVPDGGAPTMEQASKFARFVKEQRAVHRPVAVHCEAGLGRTGTMLALYLISEGIVLRARFAAFAKSKASPWRRLDKSNSSNSMARESEQEMRSFVAALCGEIFTKGIIASSVLIAVVLLTGCERSLQNASEAAGAGTNQLARTELGTGAGESENWGYLGLKILKVHERQKVLHKAPWHAPGGDWTFLECNAEKDATIQFVVGSRQRSSAKGDVPFSLGEAFLAVMNPSAGAEFVESFSTAFHQPLPPRQGEKASGFLKMETAILGENQVRDPKGGFASGRRGSWTATKWFLQSETAEAEVYFNYSVATGRAEFCEKDEEYRDELIEQLVVGLRDGPLPERTPENDPTLTLVGPRVSGWRRIADMNELAQFTPQGDGLLVTVTGPGQEAKVFLAAIARPEERKLLAEFEGSVQVHELLSGKQGLGVFLAETRRKNPKIISTADPQQLWFVDFQGKHQVKVPPGVTNWFAGKGGISPDGRFVALHSWRKQGKLQNTRIVHLGDRQKGSWRAVEVARTNLELVGWEGDKPTGILLTGNNYGKGEVRKPYSLDPETGLLSPREAIPAQFDPKIVPSPSRRRTVEVQEKQRLVIADLAGRKSQIFTFHPSDRRSLDAESVRWVNERYLAFQGPRTALVDADTLKMSYPVTRESGFASAEFSSDFKWALGTKKDGQYLGGVDLPENRKAAE